MLKHTLVALEAIVIDGVEGDAVIVTLADGTEVHPTAFITVKV